MFDQIILNLNSILREWWLSFIAALPNVIIGMLLVVISFWVAGLLRNVVDRALRRRQADHEVTLLISRLSRWFVIGLGVLLAFQQAGTDITAFLTGLGILGFTVGFALQDVSANFMAGLLLLIQQPFDIGDTIEVNGYTGTITEINMRDTEMLSIDGVPVRIPNNDVFTNAITNYGRSSRRRYELNIGVAYDTDLDQAEQVVLDSVTTIKGVLDTPAPELAFHTFGGTTIDGTLFYWCEMGEIGFQQGRDRPLRAIKRAFEREGIQMPFPTQKVLVQQESKASEIN